MIEVEVRSFINDDDYERLKNYFNENAVFIGVDEQETHYFDCEADLRIQKGSDSAKVWLKKGRLHDEGREEVEVKVSKDKFPELEKLFDSLGYKVKVKWLRKRLTYEWRGVTVTLDDTKGYGRILELEKITGEEGREQALIELKDLMNELGITITKREYFDNKYKDYLRDWKSLLKL